MGIRTLLSLWHIFRGYRGHLSVLVVLGFVGALLEGIGIGAVVPLLSFLLGVQEPATNSVVEGVRGFFLFFNIPFTFRFLLGFIVGLFLLRAVALALFGFLRGWIGADFMYHESRTALKSLFSASWPFLLRQKLGAMHSTLVRDLQRTSTLLTVMSQIIQSFTGAFIYFAVALVIMPGMTLYTLLGGGALLLLVRPLLSRTRSVGEWMSAKEKDVSQFITEHVLGVKPLKAAAAEHRAVEQANVLVASLRALQIKLAMVVSLSTSLFQPFTILFVIALFAISYQLPGFNLISFGATLYLIQKIFSYLESGQGALHTATELVPYAVSFESFKRDLTTHAESDSTGARFVFKDKVVVDQVQLAYSNREPVLRDIRFTLPKGATVALIGPSGAGKTSVADLLLRLFTPTAGRITVDGVPAVDISLHDWRTHFGYVAQDPFLFNGSIEENIRFYRPDLSRSDIVEAAKQANIYDHIASLPDGFSTVVGDRGVMLSGGQRQRVALARVLAGKPEVLVLDEATSALDTESERLIQETIQALHGTVTVFVIAHRLSTIENADTVLVLEKGTITEQGSPKELLSNPSSYFARHYSA